MCQLTNFCNRFLPTYFDQRYLKQKAGDTYRSHFFDYKNSQNIYDISTEMFQLMDQLLNATKSLKVTKIIEENFIFRFGDFRKKTKQMKNDKGHPASIYQIMEKMKQKNRELFQVYLRIVFIYFDSKQSQGSQLKSQKRIDYEDQISVLYQDLKIKTMTSDDSFVPMDFMDYVFLLFLKMKPTYKFYNFIEEFILENQFTEAFQTRILSHIQTSQKTQQVRMIQSNMKNQTAIKNQKLLRNQNSHKKNNKQNKQQNQVNQDVKQSELTPLKQKFPNKAQRNTHDTSQKKEKIIAKQQCEPRTLEYLKQSLKLQKNVKTPFKQRTLYSKSRFFVQKSGLNFDQISSTGSNQNQDFCLIDISRSFSSRCLPIIDNDQEDFIVDATPKARKKVKLQKAFTGNFDDKGNFVRGF